MKKRVSRESNGEKIDGEVFYGIVHNFNYYLAEITVYADGVIDCWGFMDFSEFKEKLDSGWIRIDLPKGALLHIHNFGTIQLNEFVRAKTNEDFIKEIEDAIIELNGGKGRSGKCIELFKNYLLEDSEQNFADLKKQFDDLPSHKRVLFEYVFHKDPLVQLMDTGTTFTASQRTSMLDDYFEDDWDKNAFR